MIGSSNILLASGNSFFRNAQVAENLIGKARGIFVIERLTSGNTLFAIDIARPDFL